MRITLAQNPNAGGDMPSEDLVALLRASGWDVDRVSTRKRRALRRALQDPGDLVVVVGGDGTVEKIARMMVGRGIPLAILASGTANNVAKSLDLLAPTRELVDGWWTARVRGVDVGVARAPWGERCFVESAGCGIMTRLIRRGERTLDGNPVALTGSTIDGALLLLRELLASAEPEEVELTLDGRDASGAYLLVEAMNTRLVGPNVPLAPAADPFDGWLDVVTVAPDERERLVDYVTARLRGSAAVPELTVRRARRVAMPRPPRALHVDDALWGTDGDRGRDHEGPVEIGVEAGALEVLMPGRGAGSASSMERG